MSLYYIPFLYRARLGARAVMVQEGLAVLGIAVGVALLFASQVASTSLTHSVAQLTKQIVGSTQLQLQARGPAGMDERLLSEVRSVPGVQLAFPVIEQPANVLGPGGKESVDLIGTDPRYAHAIGPLLRRFSAAQLVGQRVIALPAPLAQAIGTGPLRVVDIQTGASVMRTLVGVTLGETDIGALAHSPVALAPIAYAQRLTGMRGRITRIYVRAQPGGEQRIFGPLARLAATAGVNLESATYDSGLFAVASAPDNQSETLFGGISALVGFMFAINAMLMTVPSRRRLIEDIRPQGATRGMIVQILLFDAAVIGVLACALGLVLGEMLSAYAFHATPGYLASAFPVGNGRIVTWQSVALAVGAGLAAAAVGVLWPLRDVFLNPSEEHEQATGAATSGLVVARLTIGLVCVGATAIILVARPQNAFIGCVVLVVALVCLLPPLFDGVVAIFARLQDRMLAGASSALAATELQTPRTRIRSLAIAATGAIAVFGIVAVGGAQVNLRHGLDSSAHGIDSSADVWVSPRGDSSLLTTIPFKSRDIAALERVPGVRAIGMYRGSFLNWGERRLWVLAQPTNAKQPIPPTQILAGSLSQAVARSAKAAGQSSLRHWPPNTICTSAMRSRCPHPRRSLSVWPRSARTLGGLPEPSCWARTPTRELGGAGTRARTRSRSGPGPPLQR